MKRFFSICLLGLWFTAAVALPAQQYGFRAYRQAEGLGNLSVFGLTKDNDGFLWIASENGVYRFLGPVSGFQHFGAEHGLADLDVRDVVADPSGTIWATTQTDLYRWDGFRFRPAGPTPISVPGRRLIAVEDAGHLLVIEKGRLFRLSHDADGKQTGYQPVFANSLEHAIPDLSTLASISVIRQASGSGLQIWLGAGKKLIAFTEDQLGTTISELASLQQWSIPNGVPEDTWKEVVQDSNGTLWAAGMRSIIVMPRGSRHFITRDIPGVSHDSIFGHAPLLEDPQGHMLAPAGKTLARWDGSKWQLIGRKNGLKRVSTILGMTFDSTGNLFLSVRGSGLIEWPGYGNWQGWDDDQGLPSPSVWAIVFEPGGHVVAGTEQGPAVIDPAGGDAAPLPRHQAWTLGRVSAMWMGRGGSMLAAAYSGEVVRLDPVTGHTEHVGSVPATISWGFQTSSGQELLFTHKQIYTRESETIPFHPMPEANSGLDPSATTDIQTGCEARDGSLWFASANNHLVHYDGRNWTMPSIDGLPPLKGGILGLACDPDGSLWFTGDQTGTWHLQPQNGRYQASQLQMPEAVSHIACLSILKDHRGWVWIGTELGILAWNGKEWRHLTEESGLIWNDTNEDVMKEASDGSLWFGTNGGLSHLIHPEQVFAPVHMNVALVQAKSGDRDVTGSARIVVHEGDPSLRFQVASPTIRNRTEIRLKVRMSGGIAPDWTYLTDGLVAFPRLHPGTYSFEAIACDSVLEQCSKPVSVDLRVLPAWWNTLWFRAACVMAFALLLLGIGQLYAHHLKARSKELERLVAERTQELEASRTLLQMQATHDGLTGMPNRTSVLNSLVDELERARREKRTMVVALVDLDHFKKINDEYGHLAGDEALRQFALAVRATIRPYDHSGRYGGEEFLLVLPNIPRDAVQHRLSAMHESITDLPVHAEDIDFRVNCSMGAVVTVPIPDTDAESLLSLADKALYEAKSTGRNRIVIRNA